MTDHIAGAVGGNVVDVNPSETGRVFVDAPATVRYPVCVDVFVPSAFDTVKDTS
jgi:hypothetical protein